MLLQDDDTDCYGSGAHSSVAPIFSKGDFMATINVGGNQITYGLGSIIAFVVLILAIIFMFVPGVTQLMVLGLVAALALARLIA